MLKIFFDLVKKEGNLNWFIMAYHIPQHGFNKSEKKVKKISNQIESEHRNFFKRF